MLGKVKNEVDFKIVVNNAHVVDMKDHLQLVSVIV